MGRHTSTSREAGCSLLPELEAHERLNIRLVVEILHR